MTSWWLDLPREGFAQTAAEAIAPASPEVEDYFVEVLSAERKVWLEGWGETHEPD